MSMLNKLRGVYVKSPWWIRKISAPLLASVPVKYRYGSTYCQYRKDIQKSEFDQDFVMEFQTERLKQIIKSCVESNNYYKKILENKKITNNNEFTIGDLKLLPIITKGDVRENPDKFLVTDLSQVDVVSTSGSSGKPMEFYLDKERSVKEWAFINHIWSRSAYKDNSRRAVLRGVFLPNVDTKPWEYDVALRELRISSFHLSPYFMDEYLALLEKYRINYIHGYPSAITMLALHAKKVGWNPPSYLYGILPVSEALFSYQREIILNSFGNVSIMPFYGLSEKVAIAGEVPEKPDTYEFEPLYGITELVDDEGKTIITPGKEGRIISTGLLSTSMPLLRYDTGDRGVLERNPSYENCFRIRVSGIRSRWGQEFLVTKSGVLISMTAIGMRQAITNVHSPMYSRAQEFQFYQDVPGVAILRVKPFHGYQYEDIVPLLNEIQDKVGSDLLLKLEIVESLYVNMRGKRCFIDQKLNLKSYM